MGLNKTIIIIIYTFILLISSRVLAHGEHQGEMAALDSLSDSFMVDSDHIEEKSDEINKKIKLLLGRLSNIQRHSSKNPRSYRFINGDTLTETQKNAAADILLETMSLSLDFAEQAASCTNCNDKLPDTYSKIIKTQISEFRRLMSSFNGTSFEKFESILNYIMIRYQIKRNDVLGFIGYFLRSVGVKVGGDLAEIYGERGSVALTMVFLTWIPYTFVSEIVEHSLIGPFAVFCMTSQFLYFGVIKSVFDIFTNAKNTFVYGLFSRYSEVTASNIARLLYFQFKTKYLFAKAITADGKNILSRSKLKKALHMDWLSRGSNILYGFANFFLKKSYQLGFTKKYNPYELYKIRIDAFMYMALGTHAWADLAVLDSTRGESFTKLDTVFMEPSNSLETTLRKLVDERRTFEVYIIFREMHLILDILRKQLANNLRALKETGEVSFSEYASLKAELGKMYSIIQKIKFSNMMISSQRLITGQDLTRVLDGYSDSVIMLKKFYQVVSNIPENRDEVKTVLQRFHRDRKFVYQYHFGLKTACEKYFY